MAHARVQKKTQVAKNLEAMHCGSTLVKIQKNGNRYPRVYRMENDFLMFKQTTSKKTVFFRKMMKMNHNKVKVWLKEIHDVRLGPYSDVFSKHFERLGVKENQCFSVVYGPKHKSLDLVADSTEVAESWVKGLKHLAKKLAQADLITQQEIWMREMFQYADKNKDETLSLKEVISLLKYLNIEVDHDQARTVFETRFKAADTNKDTNARGEDCLDMDEFITFYQMLTLRPEVEELFQKYNYEGQYLDPQELQDFLTKEQSIECTLEDCGKMIQSFEPCPNVKSENMMSMDGFNALMNSALMNIFNINHSDVYQDMTRPICHYWIDSSHNTYLTADQLVGPSAVESYIRALKRGCRCVELDVWDGPSGEPIIYHGHTFTSKITFKDVIACVSMYAFETSDYPLILSIENHCSVEQQRKMSQYLRQILGDKLLCDKELDIKELPSPQDMQHKILVKGKKLPPRLKDDIEDEVSDEDEAAELEDEKVKEDVKKNKKKKKLQLARELSDCVVICQSVAFKGFDYAENNYNCRQMSSLSESKVEDLAKDQNLGLIRHNTWQLTRTYPNGMRTDSSNYNPIPALNAGCQIVALNYQTPDEHMMLYKGLFHDNGGCGYILKPEFLCGKRMENGEYYHSKATFPLTWKKKLKITIISGYQLPKKKGDKTKSILDPYVQVDIRGWEGDEQSQRTEYIHNNGFNPVWNKTLEFTIQVPDLALVWFRVMDYESYSSNVMVCYFSLPLRSLMPGYRTVHLRSKKGDPIFGCGLLVNVKYE